MVTYGYSGITDLPQYAFQVKMEYVSSSHQFAGGRSREQYGVCALFGNVAKNNRSYQNGFVIPK